MDRYFLQYAYLACKIFSLCKRAQATNRILVALRAPHLLQVVKESLGAHLR